MKGQVLVEVIMNLDDYRFLFQCNNIPSEMNTSLDDSRRRFAKCLCCEKWQLFEGQGTRRTDDEVGQLSILFQIDRMLFETKFRWTTVVRWQLYLDRV